jgi:hypothetical protein
MRRAATAAFVTTVLAVTAPFASAASAQVPGLPLDCTSLGLLADPTCSLVEQVDGVLAPVEQTAGEVLAPVAPIAPAPAPADGGAVPTPAPTSSDTHATSSSAPTNADLGSAPASTWTATSPSGTRSSRVPDVPMGSTLELGPLALPSFGLAGTPAVTADQLASIATTTDGGTLSAAKAAAELPDDSKATGVVMALSVLLLAAGLLIDQARKARLPLQP